MKNDILIGFPISSRCQGWTGLTRAELLQRFELSPSRLSQGLALRCRGSMTELPGGVRVEGRGDPVARQLLTVSRFWWINHVIFECSFSFRFFFLFFFFFTDHETWIDFFFSLAVRSELVDQLFIHYAQLEVLLLLSGKKCVPVIKLHLNRIQSSSLIYLLYTWRNQCDARSNLATCQHLERSRYAVRWALIKPPKYSPAPAASADEAHWVDWCILIIHTVEMHELHSNTCCRFSGKNVEFLWLNLCKCSLVLYRWSSFDFFLFYLIECCWHNHPGTRGPRDVSCTKESRLLRLLIIFSLN